MGEGLLLALLVTANPALDEGRVLYQQLNYEQALVKLKAAAEAADSTAERREAYDLLARTWAALGDVKQAESTYTQLLAKDPLAPAPAEAAPKIRAAYNSAKSALFPPGTVRLTRVASPANKLKLQLFDPWSAVHKLELHEVDAGKEKTKTHEVKPAVEIALGATTEQAWVFALSNSGEVLASLGSKSKPLRFAHAGAPAPPPAPPAPPLVTAPDAPKPLADAQARALLEQGRDAEALQAVEAARTGTLLREMMVSLLAIQACASARLGDAEKSQLAYRKAFLLDPSLPAPDTCEEGWTAWFAARDASKKDTLEFRALPLKASPDATVATVERKSDPLGIARAMRFHFRLPGTWGIGNTVIEGDSTTISGRPGVLGWWVEILGEGGTVLTLGSPTAPLSPEGEPEKPKPDEVKTVAGPPLISTPTAPQKSWRMTATVATLVAAAAFGAGFGVTGYFAEQDRSTVNALPSTLSQRDAFSIAGRQRVEASVANTLCTFALAAVLAAASFFFFGPGGPI
jgi:tetratricopeptide (TPR) repeat protein